MRGFGAEALVRSESAWGQVHRRSRSRSSRLLRKRSRWCSGRHGRRRGSRGSRGSPCAWPHTLLAQTISSAPEVYARAHPLCITLCNRGRLGEGEALGPQVLCPLRRDPRSRHLSGLAQHLSRECPRLVSRLRISRWPRPMIDSAAQREGSTTTGGSNDGLRSAASHGLALRGAAPCPNPRLGTCPGAC